MKHFYFFMACLYWVTLVSCGLVGDKSANGFDEILQQPPYKSISDSITRVPADAGLLLRRAELLTQNNQHDVAYYDYKKSWEISPSESSALLLTSNLFLTGRSKEALELLKKMYAAVPGQYRISCAAWPKLTRKMEIRPLHWHYTTIF